MGRSGDNELLLGEWACLGLLYPRPTHGFAIAARLKPTGDIGRIWSLTRPLTYRSLDQLGARGYLRVIGEEPGIAGGPRTILAATRSGRSQFRKWMRTPVVHLRDLRSELLLKLVLSEVTHIDITAMLAAQRTHIEHLAGALDEQATAGQGTSIPDVVALWRSEAAHAALRFLDRVPAGPSIGVASRSGSTRSSVDSFSR